MHAAKRRGSLGNEITPPRANGNLTEHANGHLALNGSTTEHGKQRALSASAGFPITYERVDTLRVGALEVR